MCLLPARETINVFIKNVCIATGIFTRKTFVMTQCIKHFLFELNFSFFKKCRMYLQIVEKMRRWR